MKIQINDEVIEVSDAKIAILKDYFGCDNFDKLLAAYLKNCLETQVNEHIYRQEWPWRAFLKLNGVKSIPIDDEDLALLCINYPGYKSSKQQREETLNATQP